MKKRTAWEKIAEWLDIPPESGSDEVRILISGGVRVQMEGHRGLLEYGDDRIVAAGKNCRVIIKGENLGLEAMNGGVLAVSGRLWAVELE